MKLPPSQHKAAVHWLKSHRATTAEETIHKQPVDSATAEEGAFRLQVKRLLERLAHRICVTDQYRRTVVAEDGRYSKDD